MTALNRLTSLARLRNWVGSTTTNDDALLSQLIDATSRFILTHLQRPTLFQYIFSDVYDGMNQRSQLLRHWPVQSVALVSVDDIVIPSAANTSDSGYVLEPWDSMPPGRPQAVMLRGYEFRLGAANINIVYTTGFNIPAETHTVPVSDGHAISVDAPQGSWGSNICVNYAHGGMLVNVAANPGQGQYTVSEGIYNFSAADSGVEVRIGYSFIPADIEQACVELAGERYRSKNRIGEISKSLGGQETLSFSQKDMPSYIRTLLQPYRRVVLA